MIKNKLRLSITMNNGNELHLGANSMNELVDKIIEWQDWDSHKGHIRPEILKKEKKSGWYYIKEENGG